MISLIKSLQSENLSLFYKNIDSIFTNILKTLGVKCGILVLREDTESFIEYASFGYESDFYYSFLSRGNGYFENISLSEEPVEFLPIKFSLYDPNSIVALGVRIQFL